MRLFGFLAVASAYTFILAPVIFVILISFSADSFVRFPPSGWSLKWYSGLFAHSSFRAALATSLEIASLVTCLAMLIGVPAAFAIVRMRKGREGLYGLLTAPQLMPSVVLGLALLLVFAPNHLVATKSGVVIAHLVITLPFVIRVLVTAFGAVTRDYEDAAATLGASPAVVFRRITLPLIVPGLLSAGAIAFIVSFDETVVTIFLSGPRFTTLPVEIYNYVSYKTDPLIAALSTFLLVATALLVTLVERSMGLMRAVGR